MRSPVGTAQDAEMLRRRHEALVAELREVDHWRRLVAARLDLAVAAVTAIEELPPPGVRQPSLLPFGLRDLVGLPACDEALPEAGALMQLRAVLRDLDAYATELRAVLRTTARDAAMAVHPSTAHRPRSGARTTRTTAAVIPFPQRGDAERLPAEG